MDRDPAMVEPESSTPEIWVLFCFFSNRVQRRGAVILRSSKTGRFRVKAGNALRSAEPSFRVSDIPVTFAPATLDRGDAS